MNHEIKQTVLENIDNMSEVTDSITTTNTNKKESELKDDPPKKSRKKRTQNNKNHAAAVTATHLTFTIGRMIAGKKGGPSEELNEEENLTEAYKAYFESKGISDIPPGCSLLIVLFAYSARIIKEEQSQSKIEKIFGWIKKRFSSKQKRVSINAAQSDNRND